VRSFGRDAQCRLLLDLPEAARQRFPVRIDQSRRTSAGNGIDAAGKLDAAIQHRSNEAALD
jgi:hypothetical protein